MSQQQILTTHVGFLPRRTRVTDFICAHEQGKAINPADAGVARPVAPVTLAPLEDDVAHLQRAIEHPAPTLGLGRQMMYKDRGDAELWTILPTPMRAKPQWLLFETSNPRHQQDWQYFRDMAEIVPQSKVLLPGVLDLTTTFIEHARVGAALASERLSARVA